MTDTVVWVTTAFPHGHGEQFIETELEAWQQTDASVVFLPGQMTGPRRRVPEGYEVDDALARAWSSRLTLLRQAAAAVFDPALRDELRDLRARGALTPGRAVTALRAVAQARVVEKTLVDLARRRGPFTVAYTYWLKPHTCGAVRARARGAASKVISRCHGSDLYEEGRPHQYNALMRTLGHRIDTVHVISEQGCEYLHDTYGIDRERIALSRLGVTIPDASHLSPPSTGDDLEIITISSLTPLKRMSLIIDALAEVATRLPQRTLRWRHFGDGPLRPELEAQAERVLTPKGVVHEFMGQVSHDDLLVALDRPTDLMLNASTTEGVPVSIMETAVRGIPCIATDVGATSEVVDRDSGYLVPKDLTASVLADRVVELCDDARTDARRQAVRRIVVDRFDAERNFREFVETVTEDTE